MRTGLLALLATVGCSTETGLLIEVTRDGTVPAEVHGLEFHVGIDPRPGEQFGQRGGDRRLAAASVADQKQVHSPIDALRTATHKSTSPPACGSSWPSSTPSAHLPRQRTIARRS